MELQVDHFDKLAKLKSLWAESRVENETFKMKRRQTLKQIKDNSIVSVHLNSIVLHKVIAQLFTAFFPASTCEV